MQLVKHDHGEMYRAKIVPFGGAPEYGEWFGTESDVRSAARELTRRLGTRYYCEVKKIACCECEADEEPRVIAPL